MAFYPNLALPADHRVGFGLRGDNLQAANAAQPFHKSLAQFGRALVFAEGADINFLDLRKGGGGLGGADTGAKQGNGQSQPQKDNGRAAPANRPCFAHNPASNSRYTVLQAGYQRKRTR